MSPPLAGRHLSYQQLCDLLPDESRVELLDGEVWMSPAPGVRHQLVVGELYAVLRAAAGEALVLLSPVDVLLAEDTVLQPDLLVVSGERRGIVDRVVRGAPDLVVEVSSPGTRRRDRGVKIATYGRFGVGECWIVDPEARTIERLVLDERRRELIASGIHRPGDSLTTPVLPGLTLDPGEIFVDR